MPPSDITRLNQLSRLKLSRPLVTPLWKLFVYDALPNHNSVTTENGLVLTRLGEALSINGNERVKYTQRDKTQYLPKIKK